MTKKTKQAKRVKRKAAKDLGLDGSFTMTAICPRCSFPNGPDGEFRRGRYTPGKPCPNCKFTEMTIWKTPSRGESSLLEPSPVAQEAARALLTPPPEFQAVMAMLKKNTEMLEQTANAIELLTAAVLAEKTKLK